MKIIKSLIHVTNLAWSIRVFLVFENNSNSRLNFLQDLPFLLLVGVCVVLHSIRWARASTVLPVAVVGQSEIHRMQVIANYMYGVTPYFGRIIPSSTLLKNVRIEEASSQNSSESNGSMSVQHILRINQLIVSHFIAVCLGVYFLANAGMPSFAGFLSEIWVALPVLVCFGTAILIYSITTLVFYLVFKVGNTL